MARLATLSVFLLCLSTSSLANFHAGDFIQASRRAQFEGQRTHWHDFIGRHCPRFGDNSLVAVPLPRPKGYEDTQEYKVQLSFDHERLMTSWITVLDKNRKRGTGGDAFHTNRLRQETHVPYAVLTLVKRGDELIKVRAEKVELPQKYLQAHIHLVEEYENATHWPKHLLVKYNWESLDEIDAQWGLIVLLYGGLVALVTALFGVLISYKDKFADLIREVTMDEHMGGQGEKGE